MNISDIAQLKSEITLRVDELSEQLLDISHDIHAHPETNFEEVHAHQLLTDALSSQFSTLQRSAYGLETAFAAQSSGSSAPGSRRVAIFCEYDALPEIGHACGHNVIAAAGLGAALALQPFMKALPGELLVFGTPAEEGGGGKIAMARQGAFDHIDAAMMVHPADFDLTSIKAIAIQECCARFHGKAAHAAAAPHLGNNALDAAVQAYSSIGALRQHIRPSERIHGIFTHGGDKPNIVPHFAAQQWYVRSDSLDSLQPLKVRVEACFHGAALSTGCTVDVEWENHAYADMRDSESLLNLYLRNAELVGRSPQRPTSDSAVVGSTDMGNVSYLAPSIHPMIQVAPHGVPIHTPRFAQYARAEEGDRAVIDGAKILALTALDALLDDRVGAQTAAEFARIGPPPVGLI
ncbi:MAG: M20 family metallopeptidase [Actinomycetes bacterium]